MEGFFIEIILHEVIGLKFNHRFYIIIIYHTKNLTYYTSHIYIGVTINLSLWQYFTEI